MYPVHVNCWHIYLNIILQDYHWIIIIIGGCFSDVSGFAFFHVASSVCQSPWIHMVMYYYSDFMDSTFLRMCAVPRIADLWRLWMLWDPGILFM